jgi:hypothetical protein
MAARHHDLRIDQGDTFLRTIRWETKPFLYKAISAISQAAPVQITATGHGLTDGWRVAVIGVVGMLDINSPRGGAADSDFIPSTYVDANNIQLNEISSEGFDPWVSGGYLKFYTPVDLSGYSADMQIRDSIGGTILDTTDAGGNISVSIDNTTKQIVIIIPAAATAAYTWNSGVYDLQMTDGSGNVTKILKGDVTVSDEVTT